MPGVVYIAVKIRSLLGARPTPAGQRLVGNLTLDQREVELARLEERHVFRRALGVAGAHLEGGIDLVDDLGEGVAVDGKASARGGRAESDHDSLRSRFRAGGQEQDDGEQGAPHQRTVLRSRSTRRSADCAERSIAPRSASQQLGKRRS